MTFLLLFIAFIVGLVVGAGATVTSFALWLDKP